ncbi:MAG: hypothetical protein SWH78_17935 [Thermodesulfobacteriota bacterium]|nr:hypothetical protein [Thermodesulfobacteriota bacterium]
MDLITLQSDRSGFALRVFGSIPANVEDLRVVIHDEGLRTIRISPGSKVDFALALG